MRSVFHECPSLPRLEATMKGLRFGVLELRVFELKGSELRACSLRCLEGSGFCQTPINELPEKSLAYL